MVQLCATRALYGRVVLVRHVVLVLLCARVFQGHLFAEPVCCEVWCVWGCVTFCVCMPIVQECVCSFCVCEHMLAHSWGGVLCNSDRGDTQRR